MPLTPAQLAAFIRDGAVVLRDAVAPRLVARARSPIDEWYRTEMDTGLIETYTQRTFAPDHSDHPDLLALFHRSGIDNVVQSMIGQIAPVAAVQIQIRVPESQLPSAQPEKAMHVDGVACPHLDPNELRTFTLLVGVVLSDVNDATAGALRYVPGGHRQMAEWFRTEWALGISDQVPPHVDAARGTALTGKPGDVLLMHHLVPHAVGRNLSEQPRIMAYFRVKHTDHDRQRLDSLRNPWLEFRPLRQAATA
jgi:ectoine hydroxylase-related dioxygenase (phytanoyl-CoA dioxygenase family)